MDDQQRGMPLLVIHDDALTSAMFGSAATRRRAPTRGGAHAACLARVAACRGLMLASTSASASRASAMS